MLPWQIRALLQWKPQGSPCSPSCAGLQESSCRTPWLTSPITLAYVSFLEAKDGPSLLGLTWREMLPDSWGRRGSGVFPDARAVGAPSESEVSGGLSGRFSK